MKLREGINQEIQLNNQKLSLEERTELLNFF